MADDVFEPKTGPEFDVTIGVQKRLIWFSTSLSNLQVKSYLHASPRSPVKSNRHAV